MDIPDLQKDRFLRKDPNQTDGTKGAVYTSLNPVPKQGDTTYRKIGTARSSEEDNGAPNVLTGTVIVACFIQTSALPSRIELQGNDLTFFDDTTTSNGVVSGDTSRLIFTHGSGKSGEKITEGFIIEKRASIYSTYDNVLSLYALPAKTGSHNYMFIGRNATGTDTEANIVYMQFLVNRDTTTPYGALSPNALNGVFVVGYTEDSDVPNARYAFLAGNSEELLGPGFTGLTTFISAANGGLSGIAFDGSDGGPIIGFYMNSVSQVTLGLDLIPDTDGAYDIGSPSFKIRNIYADSITGASSAADLTLTGTPGIGATSATLTAAWTGTSMFRVAGFPSGEIRLVAFINGSASISWAVALTVSAGGNEVFTYM